MFALFGAETVTTFGKIDFLEGPMKRLVSGIPDKIKFVMGSQNRISIPEPSESLELITPLYEYMRLQRLLLDILNKRWQTLDLISMMEELKRSVNEECNRPDNRQELLNPFPLDPKMVLVKDSLSSRPRFKKEEELTECA